jgi:hypothetical protein
MRRRGWGRADDRPTGGSTDGKRSPTPSEVLPRTPAGNLVTRIAWGLVGIRIAFWVGTSFTLLWSPLHGAHAIPPFRAYDSLTDLLFGTFAQWDSVWFLHIAEHGYDSKSITAFFPLYPMIVHVLAQIVGSTIVAGVLVSLAAAAVTGTVFVRLARDLLGERAGIQGLVYLSLYPIGYVFTALYSDGLFLALAVAAFLAAQRRNGLAAGVLGGLAVGTRIMGLALVPALLVMLWPKDRSVRELVKPLPILLLPGALAAYAFYLRHRFGDAFVTGPRFSVHLL